MQLLLEIVSAQGGALGANRRRVVGPAGVRIGREANGNDWVINSDYVSRHHAIIRCLHGLYYVEAKSNALTAVNDRARPLAKDEAQPLRDGDMLFIDEFEIQVRQASADAVQAPAAPAAGLLDDLMSPTPAARAPAELAGSAAPHDVLDLLGGAPARSAPINYSSQAAPASEPSRLDDLLGQNYAPPSVQHAPSPPSSSKSAGLDDDWFKTSMPKTPVPAPRPAKPQPAPPPRATVAPTSQAPPPPQFSAPPPVAAAPPSAAIPGDLAGQILAGTGIDPARHALRPEVLQQFGSVLRTVVDGTMEVLRARSEIKDAFRLPETRIARSHNNPLKFSVDGADALFNLLVKRNDAYLDTEAAFEDAFDDIRFHQLAMLKGMQAGFEKMLEHFDPAELQKKAEKSGGLSFAGLGGRKGRLWDEHAAAYQALIQDRDDAFRRLFGDAFGRAYEEELRRLKTAGSRRSGGEQS
jgi:type VI secretion system protein ImpI